MSIRFFFPFILLLFGFDNVYSQLYQMKKMLSPSEKNELLHKANELFEFEPLLSYSFGTDDLKASFTEINDPKQYNDEYLKKLENTYSKDSLNSFVLYLLGDFYTNTGILSLAESYFKKALDNLKYDDFKTDRARYYSARGMIKFSLKKEDANMDFEKSLSINPNDSVSMSFYPFILIATGAFENASNILTKSLEQKTKQPSVPYSFFICSELLKKFQEIHKTVQENTDKKYEYRKKDYQQLFDYALINKYEKKFKKNTEIINARVMADIFGLYLKLVVFDLDSVSKEPILQYTQSDLKTIAHIQDWLLSASINNQLNGYSVNRNLGMINYMLGNSSVATDYFSKAIEIFPLSKLSDDFNPYQSFENLITIYHSKGDTANWRKTIEKRISMDPFRKELKTDYLNLSYYFLADDSFEKAKYWAKKAEKIDADHFETLRLLAHLNFLDGLYYMTDFYANIIEKTPFNSYQAYKLFLQFGIYGLFNGVAQGAYNNIETARKAYKEYLPNTKCNLCDELESKYIELAR